MAGKKIPATAQADRLAINLVERLVTEMGFAWRGIDILDVGVDGEIELRNTQTGEALHRLLRAQVKGHAEYPKETADSFEFACTQADVDYWLRSALPVLLICCHPASGEAWWKCVTDYFRANPDLRESGRVRFDKRADAFDSAVGGRLAALGGGRGSVAMGPVAVAEPEELISNLFPLVQVPDGIYAVSTACRRPSDAHEVFEAGGQGRAADYLLRDRELYTFRDPGTCPLGVLGDGEPRSFPASDWSESDDPTLKHRFAELLRRTLLQQMKRQLRWQPKRKLFYFRSWGDPPHGRSIRGATVRTRKEVVKVSTYTDAEGVLKVAWIRHRAFYPQFLRVDGRWYLAVVPDYYFTYDGERETFKAPNLSAGIKRLDRNQAVLGNLRMWERLLTEPPSLLAEGEAPLLVFGPPEVVTVDRMLDEARWEGRRQPPEEGIPGQERLVA